MSYPAPRVQYVCLGIELVEQATAQNRTCEHHIYFLHMMDYVAPVDEIGKRN